MKITKKDWNLYSASLFVWRFQPFHKWHIDAIRQILNESKKLLIVIGSSNNTWTEKNPLNNDIRLKLIKDSLSKEAIDLKRFEFYFVPDFGDWKKWTNYIIKSLPKFDIVYSACSNTLEYFKDVCEIKLLKKNINISASKIRNLIRNNDNDWKNWTYLDNKSYFNF